MMARKSSMKVSVLCSTYNHAQYIRQALDSMLMQKTNFDFEILINDDHSTDGTTEIIEEYQQKYPNTVKVVFHRENMYSKGVRGMMARYLLPKAKGEYIALCEGDDYWTDENKLQLQVDFLDKNSGYSVCFHPVCVEGGGDAKAVYPDKKADFTMESLLRANYIQTNSVMYRALDYANLHNGVMPGDWYLHIYHAEFGEIGFIDKIMGVYRLHEGSTWSSVRNDEVGFWTKFGPEHLEFFLHVFEIIKGNSAFEAIVSDKVWDVVINILKYATNGNDTVLKLTDKYPQHILGAMAAHGDETEKLRYKLNERDTHIHELNVALAARQKEIIDMKSSKIWRLRNILAKLLGKQPL